MISWHLSPSAMVSYCNQYEILAQWLVERLPHHPGSIPHYLGNQDVHAFILKNKRVSTSLMDTVHSKWGEVLRVSWVCVYSSVGFWYKMFLTIEEHCITKGNKFICLIKDMSILSTSPWRVITVSEPHFKTQLSSIRRILPPFYQWKTCYMTISWCANPFTVVKLCIYMCL